MSGGAAEDKANQSSPKGPADLIEDALELYKDSKNWRRGDGGAYSPAEQDAGKKARDAWDAWKKTGTK